MVVHLHDHLDCIFPRLARPGHLPLSSHLTVPLQSKDQLQCKPINTTFRLFLTISPEENQASGRCIINKLVS